VVLNAFQRHAGYSAMHEDGTLAFDKWVFAFGTPRTDWAAAHRTGHSSVHGCL